MKRKEPADDCRQPTWPDVTHDLGPDELIAFRDGQLTPAEEDGYRERLVSSPASVDQLLDLDQLATLGPPAEEQMTAPEVAAAWEVVARRLERRGAAVPRAPLEQLSKRWLALAAGLTVVAVGLAGATVWLGLTLRSAGADLEALETRVEALSTPQVNVAVVELFPPGFFRGSAAPRVLELPAVAGSVYILLNLPQPAAGDVFTLRIINSAGATIWTGDGLIATPANTVSIALGRELLAPGRYRFELSAGELGVRHRVSEYLLELRRSD